MLVQWLHTIWRRLGVVRTGGVALWTAAALTAAQPATLCAAGQTSLHNEFLLDRMLTFYVVNTTGQNFDVTVRWLCPWQMSTDSPVLVRVLDPNEQEVGRVLDPGLRITGTPGEQAIVVPVAGNGPGVYQVIVTGSTQSYVEFSLAPEMSWGVYGYPLLHSTATSLDAYIHLPPGLPRLDLQVLDTVSSLQLIDGNGIVHLNVSGANPSGTTVLPTGTPDAVWRLTANGPAAFGLDFGGAPIIACPDQATALAIHSSIDVLPDGTICYHKFQVAAHDALAEYRAMDPSAFVVSPPSFQAHAAAWTANPARNVLLLGPYGVFTSLPATLAEQNLDPASPWFGVIYTWHDANGQEQPNPFITYDRLGFSQLSPTLNALAAVYAIDAPFNPLRHDPNLLNRIVIAALQELMMVREHELTMPEYLIYEGGEKAFIFARNMRWVPWAIVQCPGSVRSILIDGLRRQADHMLLAAVPNMVNQWSFIMIGLQSFAAGVGEAFYHAAVDRQIDWLLSRTLLDLGFKPAGYFDESAGPDTTYHGISLHNLAWLAEQTGRGDLKNAIARVYRTLNHTMAPESDGSWVGTTSFAHRTPDAWTQPQWGAGVAITGDDSDDAGVLLGHTWLPWRIPQNANQLHAQQLQIQPLLEYHGANAYTSPQVGVTYIADGPMVHVAAWEHFLSEPVAGQLPMKQRDRFTRKMGDEFFFVRRPTYYAFLYCGKTMEYWQEGQRPTDPKVQYPRNGGGLSMFWSPKFGSSILSQNWSAYSSNAVIARKGNQTFFENYWSVTSGIQESLARATINGDLAEDSMTFRRQMNFLEDRVQCDLRLHTTKARSFDDLWECFPYPLDKPGGISVTLHDANGVQINGNNKVASAIVFHGEANEVHIVAFDSPRRCAFGSTSSTDVYGNPREIGRVLASLPAQWSASQARVFKWSMKAVRPQQVQQTIQQMIQAM
jgi:hypothetical protein